MCADPKVGYRKSTLYFLCLNCFWLYPMIVEQQTALGNLVRLNGFRDTGQWHRVNAVQCLPFHLLQRCTHTSVAVQNAFCVSLIHIKDSYLGWRDRSMGIFLNLRIQPAQSVYYMHVMISGTWYWIADWEALSWGRPFPPVAHSFVICLGLRPHEIFPSHVSMSIGIIIVMVLFRQPCQ